MSIPDRPVVPYGRSSSGHRWWIVLTIVISIVVGVAWWGGRWIYSTWGRYQRAAQVYSDQKMLSKQAPKAGTIAWRTSSDADLPPIPPKAPPALAVLKTPQPVDPRTAKSGLFGLLGSEWVQSPNGRWWLVNLWGEPTAAGPLIHVVIYPEQDRWSTQATGRLPAHESIVCVRPAKPRKSFTLFGLDKADQPQNALRCRYRCDGSEGWVDIVVDDRGQPDFQNALTWIAGRLDRRQSGERDLTVVQLQLDHNGQTLKQPILMTRTMTSPCKPMEVAFNPDGDVVVLGRLNDGMAEITLSRATHQILQSKQIPELFTTAPRLRLDGSVCMNSVGCSGRPKRWNWGSNLPSYESGARASVYVYSDTGVLRESFITVNTSKLEVTPQGDGARATTYICRTNADGRSISICRTKHQKTSPILELNSAKTIPGIFVPPDESCFMLDFGDGIICELEGNGKIRAVEHPLLDLTFGYSTEVLWSPDSRWAAFIIGDPQATGKNLLPEDMHILLWDRKQPTIWWIVPCAGQACNFSTDSQSFVCGDARNISVIDLRDLIIVKR